LICRSINSSD